MRSASEDTRFRFYEYYHEVAEEYDKEFNKRDDEYDVNLRESYGLPSPLNTDSDRRPVCSPQ